jgi:hypothetical protein
MKTGTKNKKKENSINNTDNFKFYWIFLPNGVSIQKHNEADYSNFLNSNYVSKSNQELNISIN